MTDKVEKIKYSHFLGSLLSSQTPYLFMIGCGYFFGRVGLIQKEGLIAFAKLNIEVFFPVYFFIQVCRSTFVDNFKDNGVIIISFLFYFALAFILSLLYTIISKMDLRYRFTFISITSFIDIKRLHYLYINSFCFFLKNKFDEEKVFCDNIIVNSQIHIFFQGILIWYLSFNLIRVDRNYQKQTLQLWERATSRELKTETAPLEPIVELKEVEKKSDKEEEICDDYFKNKEEGDTRKETEKENTSKENVITGDISDKDFSLTNEEKNHVKEIYKKYNITTQDNFEADNQDGQNNNNNGQVFQVFAGRSFYNKIKKFNNVKFCKNGSYLKELIYILFRAPLIGLFVGFVVGFIKVIREWIYDTTTPVYLFFDTFNNIGNCNILVGFLMMGANLSIRNENDLQNYMIPKIRGIDYIAHFILKIIILPFCGVIFSYVINKEFFPQNRPLNFTCFIQWIIPTSLDILAIIQQKDINIYFVGVCMFVQFCSHMIINNLLHIPCFLKVIDSLSS